jgi:hypothetical protein
LTLRKNEKTPVSCFGIAEESRFQVTTKLD